MAVKIVTLCGSRKYAAVFETVELALSKQGVIVLKPAFSDEVLTPIELQNLRQTHLKKIDLADEVVVINVAATLVSGLGKKLAMHSVNIREFGITQLRKTSIN